MLTEDELAELKRLQDKLFSDQNSSHRTRQSPRNLVVINSGSTPQHTYFCDDEQGNEDDPDYFPEQDDDYEDEEDFVEYEEGEDQETDNHHDIANITVYINENTGNIERIEAGENNEDEDIEEEDAYQKSRRRRRSASPEPESRPKKSKEGEEREQAIVRSKQSYSRDELLYFKNLETKEKEKTDDLEYELSKINNQNVPLRFRIYNSDMDIKIKALAIHKLDSAKRDSENDKAHAYVEAISKLPIGKYKKLPISSTKNIDEIGDFLKKTKAKLDESVYGHEEAKNQVIMLLAKWMSNENSKGMVIALQGAAGVGKCMAKNTPILMYDGRIKKIQDIKEHDILMGDNSEARNVLSLARGKDNMYDIIPVKGDKYTVNSEHILCLRYSSNPKIELKKNKTKDITYKVKFFDQKSVRVKSKTFDTKIEAEQYINRIQWEKNIEISVKDYLVLPKSIKKELKGYRTAVDFPSKNINLDPYILGLWIGDGNTNKSMITNQDATVLKYLMVHLPQYGVRLSYQSQYDYLIISDKSTKKNKFTEILRQYNLFGNKHIPDIYKINDRDTRLKLLAGLIDSDGSLVQDRNTYDILQKVKQISDDILYIARSLGFAAYQKQCEKSCEYKGKKFTGTYYRVCISGEGLENIPVQCIRKKAKKRRQIKDALVTGIRVEPVGYDDYYGFTLDGNHKYILGDFTVTHNTIFCKSIAEAIGLPMGFVSLGGMASTDSSILLGHSQTYSNSRWGKLVDILIDTQCMNPVIYFDELDKISTTRHGEEITNALIHLTDSSQNDKVNDRYFTEIDLDFSRSVLVFSYNHDENVNPILKDRMNVINTTEYTVNDKINIAKHHMIPKIFEDYCLGTQDIVFDDETLKHIISRCEAEKGVRNFQRSLENIVSNINLMRLLKKPLIGGQIEFPLSITNKIADTLMVKKKEEDWKTSSLYI